MSKSPWFIPILTIVFPIMGILPGCIVGYYSAHYFAIFGGFALIGKPHSPARDALVPGHILLWIVIFVLLGLVIGGMMDLGIWAIRKMTDD